MSILFVALLLTALASLICLPALNLDMTTVQQINSISQAVLLDSHVGRLLNV